MDANTRPLQPDSAGPDTSPEAQWTLFGRIWDEHYAAELGPMPTPEEFRPAVDEVAAELEPEAGS